MKKIFFLMVCLVPFFSGCQKRTSTQKLQQLNLNIPADPATLDPRKGGDVVSSLFHFLLFDGLMRLDDYNNVALSLAKRVEISDDKTVYTFHLRESYWSDGSPVTAWDFEKSWKDILSPEFPSMNAHLLYPIKNAEGAKRGLSSLSEVGIRSLDALTLEVTLEKPTPYFLELVAFCVFFPVNAEIDHAHPDWDQQIGKRFICSGPFKLKEWKRGNTIVLAKNPHYYRSKEVLMEKIHLNMVDSEMTSLQMFEKGEIDILGQPLVPLPTDAIPHLAKQERLQTHQVAATTFVSFNVDKPPFNNGNIRKAFSLAMNRRQITRNITQLSEDPALSAVPPILKKWKSTPFFDDADIETAQAHFQKGLDELGLTRETFPKIKYHYMTSEAHHKIAQALQQQWSEVLGITLDLESVEKKILLHLLTAGNYQIAQSFWVAQYNDPMNILERFKHKENIKNYANWENPTYADLLTASALTSTTEERKLLLEKAEAILIEEMPIAPIYHWNSAYITKPYVKTFGEVCIGNGFLDRVYIEDDENNSPL